MLNADPYLLFEGKNGKMFTLSGTVNDMEAFLKIDDSVIEKGTLFLDDIQTAPF